MNDIIEKILINAGPLGVLVVVVWMFLKSMAESRSEWIKAMQSVHEEHIAARQAQSEMLSKMISAFDQVSKSNEEMARAIATCPLKQR